MITILFCHFVTPENVQSSSQLDQGAQTAGQFPDHHGFGGKQGRHGVRQTRRHQRGRNWFIHKLDINEYVSFYH